MPIIEGPILGPLDSARTLIANTARWQALREALTPDLAALSIFLEQLDEPEDGNWENVLPFCVVMNTIPAGFHAAKDAHDSYEHDGTLQMWFFFGNNFELDADNRLQVSGDVGVIIEQMELISGDDSFLNLTDIVVVEGPVRAQEVDELKWGPTQVMGLQCRWGT